MATNHIVSMKALLEAGVHFGHRTRRWNPKMKPYIFTERNGIHIIDLQQTITRLNQAYELVKEAIASGGTILFVGTKRQAQETVLDEATRCNMPYVKQRWLGGTLTNWRTIRQRIDYLLDIEKQQARGEFARLIKKEALQREREIARLNHRVGGLKEMRRLPNLVFIIDVRRDALAVKEANILGIPIIAMVDTNCDPDPIDHVIPSNDDAIRAIKLVVSTMANAVLEGQAILTTLQAEEEEAAAMEEEEVMERYLGPSTLAKIQAAEEMAEEVVTEEEEVAARAEIEEAVEIAVEEEEVAAVTEIEEEAVEIAEEVAEAPAEVAEAEALLEEAVEEISPEAEVAEEAPLEAVAVVEEAAARAEIEEEAAEIAVEEEEAAAVTEIEEEAAEIAIEEEEAAAITETEEEAAEITEEVVEEAPAEAAQEVTETPEEAAEDLPESEAADEEESQ